MYQRLNRSLQAMSGSKMVAPSAMALPAYVKLLACAKRPSFVAMFAFFSLFAFHASVSKGQDAAGDTPVIASSSRADNELNSLIDALRTESSETGEVNLEAKRKLQSALEKQIDSYIENFEDSLGRDADSDSKAQLERLGELRDSFVGTRLEMICKELIDAPVPGMLYQAYFDICSSAGIRVRLNGRIETGVPMPDSRVVALSLPKMDCPGCAMVVETQLGKIEGVYDTITNVEKGSCQIELSADLNLEEELDKLAETVVQFEEWAKQ